jgi:4-carboxymuconolactone decarboxylase
VPQPNGATRAGAGSIVTTVLDAATRGLVRVALGLPSASETQLGDWMRAALYDGTPAIWLEELLLSSVLYVGFPRALVAAAVFRRLEPDHASGGEISQYEQWREWLARGEDTCRVIYGKHYEQLRRNVQALHPALDLWMLVDGYGKTLSRPGLDLMRRELCSVAMLIPENTPRQLLSHLRGALNAGASVAQVDAVLEIAGTLNVGEGRLEIARGLWQELKDTLLHD